MKESVLKRPPATLIWLGVLLLGVLAALLIGQGLRIGRHERQDRPLEGLQVLWPVPDFSLTERSGRRVALADLRGTVWIANFIYTHCTDTCPLQSAAMARLQADLSSEPDVRLVSITVDPDQDTPDVLAEYATRFGADRDRWLFLTGEKKIIYALAQGGFRLGAVDPAETGQSPPEGSPAGRSGSRQQQSLLHRLGPQGQVTRLLDNAMTWLLEPAPAMAHPGHAGKPFMHSSLFLLVDRHTRIRGYYHSDDQEALGRLRRDVRALLREDRP